MFIFLGVYVPWINCDSRKYLQLFQLTRLIVNRYQPNYILIHPQAGFASPHEPHRGRCDPGAEAAGGGWRGHDRGRAEAGAALSDPQRGPAWGLGPVLHRSELQLCMQKVRLGEIIF